MGRDRAVRSSPPWRLGFAATEAAASPGGLLPEERALVAGSSAARQAEFATGRHCARLALASLSPRFDRMPVLADARGAPVWPAGAVGSITHCPGWTGAVVARSPRFAPGSGVRALGLDAGPAGHLPTGVLEVVASEGEQAALVALGRQRPGIPWDAVLFGAKEAAYKAWYPLTSIVVAHDAVSVQLLPSGRFTAVVTADDPTGRRAVHRVRGRWGVGPRVVVVLGLVG
jgi:4'-phosphopantetheinyl transferase EntD